MIMDLPKNYLGNGRDIFVENNILKIHKNVPFRKLVYELTYELKGGKHKCLYCNSIISNNKASLDHLYPQDFGGPTITNNLLPCCLKCNNEKSNMTAKEYKNFLVAKKIGQQKGYLKTLQKRKDNLRISNRYQIPDEWLCEYGISNILVLMQLDNPESYSKYHKVRDFYKKYGYFQKPILLDRNGFLLDGFYTVLYAKKHKIPFLKAIKLDNVEVFF